MGAHGSKGSKEKFGRSASERYASNNKYIEQERFGRFGKHARGNQFYTNEFLFLLDFFFLYCRASVPRVRNRQIAIRFRLRNWWLLFLHFEKSSGQLKENAEIRKEQTTTTTKATTTETKTGIKKKWSTLAIVQ